MPRKHLEILKDLFIAHREKDEKQYQDIAKEFVHYLNWKGWHNKAADFERIIKNEEEKNNDIQKMLNFPNAIPSKQEKPTKLKKKKATWQVSKGASIDFVITQNLIKLLIDEGKKKYSNKDIKAKIGFSKDKTQGFSRLLYYLGLLKNRIKTPTELAKLIYTYNKYYSFADTGKIEI